MLRSSSYFNDDDEIPQGTPIVLKIPKIDCHKLGFPNIIGVIHKYFADVKKYEIKTKHGIVNRMFSSKDFEICSNLNIDIDDENSEKYLSLRQLARLDALKFVGCKCYGKCQNNKCFCYKNNRECGSLCKHKCTSDICLNRKIKKLIQTRSSSRSSGSSSSGGDV